MVQPLILSLLVVCTSTVRVGNKWMDAGVDEMVLCLVSDLWKQTSFPSRETTRGVGGVLSHLSANNQANV